MVMLRGASPAALDAYENGIRELATLFPGAWGTIATADEYVRAEQWDVALEQARSEPPPGFSGACPWDSIIRATSYSSGVRQHWWETRVVLPLLQGARGGQAASVAARLEGSIPMGAPAPAAAAAGPAHGSGSSRGGRKGRKNKDRSSPRGGSSAPSASKSAPQAEPRARQFCHRWNLKPEGCSEPCPEGRRHVCMLCEGPHRSVNCTAPAKGGGKGRRSS